MATELKAIETVYNGYRFRSRLEARWAVFFDALGIKYEYEAQGYDLGEAGWYLPDFWLPDYKVWIEVKPHIRGVDYDCNVKCEQLANSSGCKVILIEGNPKQREYECWMYPWTPDVDNFNIVFPWFFATNPHDNYIWLQYTVDTEYCFDLRAECKEIRLQYDEESERINKAFTKATQARFENGERG